MGSCLIEIQQLLERMKQLEMEKKELSDKNAQVSAENKRLKEFVVFPLLALPDVVLFGIVQKLKRKHRRHLMQSCSTLRGLLHGKKSADLDCRLPARIEGTLYVMDNDLHLLVEVRKQPASRIYWKRRWVFADDGTNEIPVDLPTTVKELAENFDTEKLVLHLFLRSLADDIPRVRSIIEVASNHLPVMMTAFCPPANKVEEQLKLSSLLLETPHSVSLQLKCAGRDFIQRHPEAERQRTAFEGILKQLASELEICTVHDLTGPETECILRLDVSKNNVKCLTICG